jgi:uncharacterized glyoxalase superfamily protein PhnB
MPSLDAIGIVVSDVAKSAAFYRLLGAKFPKKLDDHIEAMLPCGLRVMLDSEQVVRSFDPKWKRPKGNSIGLAFLCKNAKEVDKVYDKVLAAGYKGKKKPWDAFWGQRYAQVLDPDGHAVDLFAPL